MHWGLLARPASSSQGKFGGLKTTVFYVIHVYFIHSFSLMRLLCTDGCYAQMVGGCFLSYHKPIQVFGSVLFLVVLVVRDLDKDF